ncbi:hypothetical protein EC844_11648 [Acinetobacter calcoaceticus]|uniref:Uncharacterized protein n=1 Tax=Acinetobacter calcoaceticus TaxID=471 RepID=A0A4R1XSN4_ACICA|nr:hypothetical protein EC844_11648 [Acinetobacter calcoaceticus]
MTKSHKIALALFSSCMIATHSASAKTDSNSSDAAKAKNVAELLLGVFSQDPSQPNRVNIQFKAAIAGITEAEAIKNLGVDANVISSPSAMMKEMMRDQFSPEDMAIISPALDRQILSQTKIMQSCKLTGQMTQPSTTQYEFPVQCQVPLLIDWNAIKQPEINQEDSMGKNFAIVADWSTNIINTAPRNSYTTKIRVVQEGKSFVPEMDDEEYFPSSVTKQIMGTSESE